MEPILTIAIPTFNNPQQLIGTVHSLVLYTEFPYRILIVNNDGTDGGRQFIDRFVEQSNVAHLIDVIHVGSNLGWMGALNVALAKTETPFFCSLNDDVMFIPSAKMFWRHLIRYFNDPKVGAVGPCSNFVMGAQSLFNLNVQPVSKTSLLIGFCKLFRTQVMKDLGGWDESLPGGDDLDTSIRLRDAGYDLICDRTVYLHHIGQQTGQRVHAGYWNSKPYQDEVNNAIIRKHGIKKWYAVFTGGWEHYTSHAPDQGLAFETEWYKEKLNGFEPGTGINIGCGSTKLDIAVNVDNRAKGDRGAGVSRFYDSQPDVIADACDLPWDNASQEFVCAAHVLEHLIDPIAALGEWKRLLKPGGILILSLPNNEMLPTMILDYSHVHAYSPKSIRSLLEYIGFSVESIENLRGGAMGVVATKSGLRFSVIGAPIIGESFPIRAIPEEQVLLCPDVK